MVTLTTDDGNSWTLSADDVAYVNPPSDPFAVVLHCRPSDLTGDEPYDRLVLGSHVVTIYDDGK